MKTSPRIALASASLSILALALTLSGCAKTPPPPPKLKSIYPVLPARENVPSFMKGTVWELTDVENRTPYIVSGYGLVVGLAGTGNSAGTPIRVRDYMIDEMVRHGFGSLQNETLRNLKPEAVLADSGAAIVEVYGTLPPGARRGQLVDIHVQPVTGSQTTSLARGVLYRTSLFVNGADPFNPRGRVNSYMQCEGPVFVNPIIPTAEGSAPAEGHALRVGAVMSGGMILEDRPLWLRIRTPQLSVSRGIEMRIDQRFQDATVANTQDEGKVNLLVPRQYHGDWEHFIGVVKHLYLNDAPGYGAMKARELADEAVKPDAQLEDISLCWEGIGPASIPFMRPLYAHAAPDVAFAAARAGAFLGDPTANEALIQIARASNHPFQFNAVKVLGALPASPAVERMLATLLSSSNALVRIEAYEILAKRDYPGIHSRVVGQSFILDRVFSEGTPLVYASRSGRPRIAVIGNHARLNTPIMFSAMDEKLTISTGRNSSEVVVFDRTNDRVIGGVQGRTSPDLAELIHRLGGGKNDGFRMSYSELVGILHALNRGKHIAGSFVLQDMPTAQHTIEEAPPIIERDGPNGPEQREPAETMPLTRGMSSR